MADPGFQILTSEKLTMTLFRTFFALSALALTHSPCADASDQSVIDHERKIIDEVFRTSERAMVRRDTDDPDERELLKRLLVLMEGETKRTIRLESRVKSLDFKAEVQAREMRSMKTKLERMAAEQREMRKQLTSLEDKMAEGGNCGGDVNATVTMENMRETLRGIASSVDRIGNIVSL